MSAPAITASLADLMKDDGKRLIPMALDVTDAAMVARAVVEAPDVTLLVNNAGYAAFQGAIAAQDMAAARREMDVNYFGPLALTRAFRPILAAGGGGAVVNMLSMAALVSLPVTGTYSASDLKGRGIRVNAISPGVIETPGYGTVGMSAADLAGYFDFTKRMTPLERNGTADDVASVVMFLASDESRFMTGSEVFVDGGFAQI